MKDKRIIFGVLIIIFILTILGVFYFYRPKNDISNDDNFSEFTYLPKLNHNDFKQKFDSGDEFYVYIWRGDCGDSRLFNEEFTNYFVEFNSDGSFARVKYDLANESKKFYSFDISEIIDTTGNKEERNKYRDLYGFYFTPSLVHYKDLNNDGISEVVNIAEWDPIYGFTVTDYMKWFYDNGLVNPNDAIYHNGQTDKKD